MKYYVLIISLFLTFFSGGRTTSVSESTSGGSQCNIYEYPQTEKASDCTQDRVLCITSAQGYSFAGNNGTNSASLRTTQSGRRVNPQIRSSFRFVKGGKVIDNNHLHPFLAKSVVHLAGIYVSERYLFSLCRLRL